MSVKNRTRRPRKLTQEKADRLNRLYEDVRSWERDQKVAAHKGRNTQGETRRP